MYPFSQPCVRYAYSVRNTHTAAIILNWLVCFKSIPNESFRNYVESRRKEIRDSSAIKSGRSWYIYDLDGRRHRIAKVKQQSSEEPELPA